MTFLLSQSFLLFSYLLVIGLWICGQPAGLSIYPQSISLFLLSFLFS